MRSGPCLSCLNSLEVGVIKFLARLWPFRQRTRLESMRRTGREALAANRVLKSLGWQFAVESDPCAFSMTLAEFTEKTGLEISGNQGTEIWIKRISM